MTPIEYVLDNRDRIISVGEAWNHFAAQNGGKNVSSKDVIGRPLWDFVAGDATRMWLETLSDLQECAAEPSNGPTDATPQA